MTKRIEPIPSVYAKDHEVLVVDTFEHAHFIAQAEKIGGDVPYMTVCYTKCENHYYLGNLEMARFVTGTMGITEQLQPVSPEGRGTCAIGFNPETQEWFGWSHRATGSFRVGTEIKEGDIGFEPSNIEEFERSMIAFYDVGKTVEYGPDGKVKRTRNLVGFEHNVPSANARGPWTFMEVEDVYDPVDYMKESPRIRKIETETPTVWGRGAWKAETLDDAKEMARAFAEAIS